MPLRVTAGLVLGLALAGCGMFGKDNPPAPVDPCRRVDAGPRQLSGALLRQPAGIGLFEILPAEGRDRRSGQLKRLELGDYTFKARPDGDGFAGRRGAKAEPIPGLAGAVPAVEALAIGYHAGDQDFAGQVLVGAPTPGSRLATTGQAHYRGPVRLTVQDRRDGAAGEPVVVAGTADLQVRFGSQRVTLAFEDLAAVADGGAVPAAAPFQRLDWTGLGVCGVRIGSSGDGGFQTAGPGGRAINFAGASAASPAGSAVLDATFYGFSEATAQPAGIGGVLLIQGDTGVISGIFAAGAAN